MVEGAVCCLNRKGGVYVRNGRTLTPSNDTVSRAGTYKRTANREVLDGSILCLAKQSIVIA